MKTFFRILFASVAGLMLAAPRAHAAGVPPGTCKAHATAALDALVHADYVGAGKGFSPELGKALGADKLEQAWTGVQKQFGAYAGHAPAADKAIKGQPVVVVRIDFAEAPLDMMVACDAQGRVAQLRFMDPSMLALAMQEGQPQAMKAHVEADGVRVLPLDVPSPAGPLHGALTLPASGGPFPAVVMVAGSGSSNMDEGIGPNKPFRDIADGLARAGVASLRYDKRPFDYPKTWGDKGGRVIDSEVTNDAVTAAHVLAGQHDIDPRRVFVLGHSLGAMMAPRIAHRDPHLAGLVLLAAPARRILDVLEQQSREQSAKKGLSAAAIEKSVQEVGKERALLARVKPGQPAPKGEFGGAPQTYWLSWSRVDPVADAKTLSLPMLFLQGGSDFQVSPTLDFARWKQVLDGPSHATFRLYPGLSHLFMPAGKTGTVADYLAPEHVDAHVIGDIAGWVKAQPPARH